MKELFSHYPIAEYFTPTGGQLVKVKVTSVIADLSNNTVHYLCNDSKGTKFIKEPVDFFKSEEDFFNNKPEQRQRYFLEFVRNETNSNIKDEQNNKLFGYGVGDKVVEEYHFQVTKVLLEENEKAQFNFKVDDNKVLPSQLYKDRETAIDYNTVEVVDADGSVKEIVGWKKAIGLTEQQLSVIAELENNLRLLKDMGVAILYDRTDDFMKAVNVGKYEYFADYEESGEESDRSIYGGGGRKISESCVFYVDEYNCLSLREKECKK